MISFFRLTGLGNLADRWPRHIVKALENTQKLDEDSQEEKGKFITLANDPSFTSTLNTTQSDVHPSEVDLKAKAIGGQNVREGDVALSPVSAIDQNK